LEIFALFILGLTVFSRIRIFNVWFYLKVVNVPSFVVRLDSQKHIDFSLKSPFGGGRAGRVKRKNAKKGSGGGGDEDED